MQTTEALLKEVQSLNETEKYHEVLEKLTDDILEKCRNADLFAEKAQAYWRLEEYRLCDKAADNALSIISNHWKANHYKGNVCSQNKQFNKAKEFYKEALKANPASFNTLYCLGDAYYDLKEYTEAIVFYNEALKINAQDANIYIGLGNCYYVLKNYERAIEYYNKSLKIDPKSAYSNNGLGITYHILTDYKKAIKYYNKALKIDPQFADPYYSRASAYKNIEKYSEALSDYKKYIELAESDSDYLISVSKSNIIKLEDLIQKPELGFINELVLKIKELLRFDDTCITHYTGFSVTKALILNNSLFRLSEGTYLNDTSEGRELFNFLPSLPTPSVKLNNTVAEQFTTKPFIGSFVAETKHDDLTLWRMYGKEDKEEACGCAITLERAKFLKSLKELLIPDNKTADSEKTDEEFDFYRVAYRKQEKKDIFIVPGASKEEEEILNKLMFELNDKLKEVFEKKQILSIRNWSELNQIAYLFKSAEYQYEHELRLIVKGTGIPKVINDISPLKVYIELIGITPLIKKITLGPKVQAADEWASIFYYNLDKQGFYPDIFISHLPFK